MTKISKDRQLLSGQARLEETLYFNRMMAMEIYNNLQSLLDGIEGKEINEWVYADLSQANENLIDTTFHIIDEDELFDLEEQGLTYETDSEEHGILPVELKDKNLSTWMTVPMIEDVVDVLRQNRENVDIPLIAKALLHYREYDDFME
jgi:hypothetical protein